MISFLIFLQTASSGHGFDWSSEQVRTFLMGFIASGVGFCVRLLWSMRDKLTNLHLDIRGDDKKPGLIDIVTNNTEEIQRIKLRNYKIDILDAAEKEMHPGVDRRHGPRRIRDQIADTYQTDEHSAEEKKR